MPDRVLAGSVPDATTAAYFIQFPPGALWVAVIERASDVTGKTIGLDIWCVQQPKRIGVQLAGPGYDMPGGPFITEVIPTAWTTAPTVDAPSGRQVAGKVNVADIVLARTGFYTVEVQGTHTRARLNFQSGVPGPEQLGPYWDEEAIRENTYLGRQEKMREEIRNLTRPNPIIGTGQKMKRTQGKVT